MYTSPVTQFVIYLYFYLSSTNLNAYGINKMSLVCCICVGFIMWSWNSIKQVIVININIHKKHFVKFVTLRPF